MGTIRVLGQNITPRCWLFDKREGFVVWSLDNHWDQGRSSCFPFFLFFWTIFAVTTTRLLLRQSAYTNKPVEPSSFSRYCRNDIPYKPYHHSLATRGSWCMIMEQEFEESRHRGTQPRMVEACPVLAVLCSSCSSLQCQDDNRQMRPRRILDQLWVIFLFDSGSLGEGYEYNCQVERLH